MVNLAQTIRKAFPKKNVVVVGDIVADQFLHGKIDRISREAPVFIIRHDQTETLAGGAANAAVNVASLGGKAILVGTAGDDESGKNLLDVLASAGVDDQFVIRREDAITTTKVRVLAGHDYALRQQVIRIDYENEKNAGKDSNAPLLENVTRATKDADAIIISDYNYGVANKEIAGLCAEISRDRNIPLLIDSRSRLREFPGATTATPNQQEIEQIIGANFSETDCENLRIELGLEALLITLGNKGMLLVEAGERARRIEVIGSKSPVDVTGAGDTVIATYALGLASGLDFFESAKLANHAGGNVVMKKGTASISVEELCDSLGKESAFKTSSQ